MRKKNLPKTFASRDTLCGRNDASREPEMMVNLDPLSPSLVSPLALHLAV